MKQAKFNYPNVLLSLAENKNQAGDDFNALVAIDLILTTKTPLTGILNHVVAGPGLPVGHPEVPLVDGNVAWLMKLINAAINNPTCWRGYGEAIKNSRLSALIAHGLKTSYTAEQYDQVSDEVETLLTAAWNYAA